MRMLIKLSSTIATKMAVMTFSAPNMVVVNMPAKYDPKRHTANMF